MKTIVIFDQDIVDQVMKKWNEMPQHIKDLVSEEWVHDKYFELLAEKSKEEADEILPNNPDLKGW